MSADDKIIIFNANDKKFHVARVMASEALVGPYRSEKLGFIFGGVEPVKTVNNINAAMEIAFQMDNRCPAEYGIGVDNGDDLVEYM